jgi:hypothetical protein
MNQPESRESEYKALAGRLRRLQNAPAPELARGRIRLARQASGGGCRSASERSRQISIALALAVSLSVAFGLLLLPGLFDAAKNATASATRVDTNVAQTNASESAPANGLLPLWNSGALTAVPRTPAPGLIPEPPRSPIVTWTRVGSLESLDTFD